MIKKSVLVALIGIILLTSCKEKGIASSYKKKKIGCDTMFSKIEILLPVFKAKELSNLNEAVEKEMDQELRRFNIEVKDMWCDWYVANEKYYPGTKTDPFEMIIKTIKVSEDEDTIVINLKGYKDDGYPEKRDWAKIVTYSKATGETHFTVEEQLIPIE